jgi:hypothetical protein
MILLRSLIIWLFIVFAEIIHGMIRGIFLVPAVGDLRSRQIGVFTGSIIIFFIAVMSIRWIGATKLSQLLMIGILWLFLMLGFEVAFGRFVMGLPLARIAADYNLAEGGLLPIGMVVLTAAPLIAAKIRKRIHSK